MIVIKPTLHQRKKGYYKQGKKINFIFDSRLYKKSQLPEGKITKVALKGSMTNWETEWKLKQIAPYLWKTTKPISDIKIPGNSGQPEFRFVVNSTPLDPPAKLSQKYKLLDSHHSGYKHIILFSPQQANKIEKINHKLKTYKTDYSSKKTLTNFREVNLGNIAQSILYRSYHPFIKSKQKHPREEKRIKTIQQLIQANKIASIINLSDTEKEIPNLISQYKKLDPVKNILFTNRNQEYDIYYYITHTKEFAQLLNKIINFILTNEPPFLIHCRLGTDRTGVITALLAALMNASWAEITADYQKSNQLGVKEYRDEKLLQHAFKLFLADQFHPKNLEAQVTKYLLAKLSCSEQKINKLKTKLSTN